MLLACEATSSTGSPFLTQDGYACVSAQVNWTKILLKGGVPDSPGRDAAVQRSMAKAASRAERKAAPKRSNRKQGLQFPSLKHSA